MIRDFENGSKIDKNFLAGIYKLFQSLIEEFLPTACSLCLKNISEDKFPRNICEKCLSKLSIRYISSNLFIMDDPVTDKFNFKSIDISGKRKQYFLNYSKGFYIFICTYYDQYFKNMVRNLKFHEGLEFAPVLADLIYLILERAIRNCSSQYQKTLSFDYIMQMPLHEKRFYERGYNQVELVAKELASLTGKKVLNNLVRIKNTKRQSEMNSKIERLNNIENAFTCNEPAAIIGKKILLIDDVVSSGKTLWEAASVLSQNGAEVLTLAITGNQKENYI